MKRKIERWRGIKGFVGYCVSDRGRVYSSKSGKILKPFRIGDYIRYLAVGLFKNGKQYNSKIHILVLNAFIGPRPGGMECRHGPRGTMCNHLGNLSWGTSKQNGQDMIRDGKSTRGENNNTTKLTERQVIEIFNSNETGVVMARRFGITNANVTSIRKCKTWGWLTGGETCQA